MRMRTIIVIGVVVAAAAVALPALADDGGRPFSTTLTGAAEVPGPGDPDATGTASVELNAGQNEVCFEESWANIDGTVFASHIHAGPAGVAGPVVVTLFTGAFSGTDSASGCVEGVSRDLIKAIVQDPSSYYINVHSTVFPAGAVRGQLAK
jgi:CHRD domain